MDTDGEVIRLAGHKLLDLVSAFDPEDGSIPPDALRLVLNELHEIGAVTVEVDDGEEVRVNFRVQPLVTAAGQLLEILIEQAAIAHDTDRLTVIGTLRPHVDRMNG